MKRTFLASAGLGVVAVFGACAVVLAGPVTPITFDVGSAASILNPHLSQNWQLFAPDPISDERGVVARFRCGPSSSPWIDITSTAIAETQSSRFFPPRESRIVSNALVERFAQDDVTKRLEDRGRDDLLPRVDASASRAERVLGRYAVRLGSCPSDETGESVSPSAVQLRYVTRALPPWSERGHESARGEPEVFESDWIPL